VGIYAQTTPATTGAPQLTNEQKALLDEALRLSHQVVKLNNSGKFDEALPLARRAVELRRSVYGNDHPLVAGGLSNVAALLLAKEKFDQAEDLFKEALSSYDGASTITQNTVYVLDSLTSLRWQVHDYGKAEHYGKRAIEGREKLYGLRSLQILEGLHNLIKVYESDGKDAEKHALYLRILTLAASAKNKVTNQVAQSLVTYYCSLDDASKTQNTAELKRQIEGVLEWQPGTTRAPISEGVLNGRALSLPKPSYPVQAREARVAGQVVVEVEINECGSVTDAKIRSGAIELRNSSLVAARHARFSPTIIGRIPFKVKGIIHYNFLRF
jgi:TonB family protein